MSKFKLLTAANPKTAKGKGFGFMTFILHLAPADLSGYQVCAKATAGCRAACLNTAGRGGLMAGSARLTEADIRAGKVNTIQAARIRRTRWYFQDRPGFMAALADDMRRAVKYARKHGLEPAFRLNGTSDIPWERVALVMDGVHFDCIMDVFPDVPMYDYTKRANRRDLPRNYHLTFSAADGNDDDVRAAIDAGMNVAVVFRDEATRARYMETGFMGRRVINGDTTDLRFLDDAGVIVGLYAKGNAKHDRSGFVRD